MTLLQIKEEKLGQKLCTLPLSYNQLNEYLSILIENDLIEDLDGTQTYKTTEKGLHFLKINNEIRKLLPQFL